MQLPDFLTEGAFGEIFLTGHRIGLLHIVQDSNAGFSAERLAEEFPSLSRELIGKVLVFYHENKAAVDAYVARCEAEIEHQRATTPRRLDIAALQRRLEEMERAGTR